MSLGKVLPLIAVLTFYAPHCLMWAVAPQASSMSCHDTEKPAPQDQGMRPCCEEQGISVSTFHAQTQASHVAMTAPVLLFAETYTATADTFVQIASPPESGKRLAELSLLRI